MSRVRPPRDVSEDPYVCALRQVYEAAWAERRAQLKGRGRVGWDDMGLHRFSYWCGRAFQLEALLDLPALWSPHEMREAANEDATFDYHAEVLQASVQIPDERSRP